MEEHPDVGGDTAWVKNCCLILGSVLTRQVSQYGLYDALSPALQKFVEGLHAVHTSRLQCKV